MSNTSADVLANSTIIESSELEELSREAQMFWLCGIVVSILCLIGQMLCFVVVEDCRKFDEKVLAQLTVSRTLNTICEYLVMNVVMHQVVKDIIFALYMHSDLVLVVWMFIFTKNLYDKIVIVFPLNECNFLAVSLMVWIISSPVGIVCPFIIRKNIFITYYITYIHIKFIIVLINAIVFVEIFRVAFKRGVNETRSVKQFLKSAFVAFLLVCSTSLHVLANDITSYYNETGTDLTVVTTFCILNSFQVIALSFIFATLVKNKLSMYRFRLDSLKLTDIVR